MADNQEAKAPKTGATLTLKTKPAAPAAPAAPAETATLSAPAAPAATETAPAVETPKVRFITKILGLKVKLGVRKIISFDGKEVLVDEKTAAELRRHMLFRNNHFFAADEVVRVGDEIQPIADTHVSEWRKQNLKVFAFPENSSADVRVKTAEGFKSVRFHKGFAAVPADLAAALEKHTFFVQGRIVTV